MSEFRCIGWFGPYCPTDALFFDSQNMRLVPFKDYEHSDQFPLEIAMKMFWEADTINMTASVTSTFAQGSVTGTCNRTIKWGLYDDNLGFFNNDLRNEVKTAAEMLCYIGNDLKIQGSLESGTFPTHTLFRESVNQGIIPWTNPAQNRTWSTVETMFISPRAYYNPEQIGAKTLYAPFGFSLVNAAGDQSWQPSGASISTYNPTRPQTNVGIETKIVGQADIITPWGSCKVDMEGGLNITAASMTITVTAADPAVRYGKPRL